MEFKGTKGEWILEATGNGWHRIKGSPMGPMDEAKANAKLIAAAPDLLEALQLIKKTYFNGQISEQHLKIIDTAINKALEI